VVVAHTNDFGVGPARPIFDIRHHITDRSIHLYAFLNRLSENLSSAIYLWKRNWSYLRFVISKMGTISS
jgi:hypothetical protein